MFCTMATVGMDMVKQVTNTRPVILKTHITLLKLTTMLHAAIQVFHIWISILRK
jgi:hypothetical protein